jgi:thiol-disulfide isomerase/thioredoxin
MKSFLIVAILLNFCGGLLAEESIVGIGVSLGTDNKTGDLKIAQVIPGGPAAGAGVKAGLLLRKIDDQDVTGKKMTECIPLIRGPIGSKVKLELLDPAENKTRQFEITRDRIVVTAPKKAERGDAAAPLKIAQWIKGGPLDPTDGKNVYVVEFWATWCPPCRVSIPHLTELQKVFKDKGVVFIGISDEPPGTVKPFVTKMGANMDYVVACDDDHQTFTAYMQAYQHNGIPTAFVVDKNGKVVWDGHPMAGLDKAIEAVLAGNKPQ